MRVSEPDGLAGNPIHLSVTSARTQIHAALMSLTPSAFKIQPTRYTPLHFLVTYLTHKLIALLVRLLRLPVLYYLHALEGNILPFLFCLSWKAHSKKCWVVLTQTLGQIWTNPAIGLHFLIYIFNQMLGFVYILPKVGLNQPSISRVLVNWVIL